MNTLNVRRTLSTGSHPRISLFVTAFALAALAATAAYAASTQAPISGEIERLSVNNPADPWSGGTIVVGGQTVIIPRNLLIDLPANRVTLVQLFTGATPGCAAVGESGLAKSDSCNTRTSGGFATIAANRTSGGNVIAGDILIEKGRETVNGVVTYINYTDGYLRVAGAPGSATTGVMIRMNDPTGRHTVQQGLGCSGGPNCSPDPRFTLDPDNYTHAFTSGYPLCLPSTKPRTFTDTHNIVGGGTRTAQAAFDGTGDILCPTTNRTINNGQPVDDSRRLAPVMLGDHISAEGNFETINGVRFLSTHTFKVSRALSTKLITGQPDYMFLDEVFIDAPGFQNKRARTLFIGYATIAPADIMIWSLHRDPKNNAVHEYPLATTVGCDIAAGAGTCTSQGLPAGGTNSIFRIRHDVDLTVNTKGKLDPCAHLRADARFLAQNPCPLNGTTAEQFAVLSPIPHEIQARTGKKYADTQLASPQLFTLDIQGQDATNGQYLFPFGIGLGGVEIPDFFEINIDLVSTPYLFSGIPWNLDRRLSPGGCNGACESTPQPLDPFPFEGLDPRTQITFPTGTYFDPNFTASALNNVQNRMLSYVDGTIGNFNGDATVLAWPPIDPAATAILPTPPLTSAFPVIVNVSPVANDDAATVVQATPTSISLLGNDFDLDGTLNPASITIVTPPAHGSVVPNGAGGVTYNSANGYAGSDTFDYTVRDSGTPSAVSNTATVTITVTAPAAASAPTAVNDSASATAGIATAINVLANDTAAAGRTINPSSVVIVTQPANGTAIANASGDITYAANVGASGNSTFTYNVKDNTGQVSNNAIVTVAVNAPPVAHNDFPTTAAATPVTIVVLANDADSDGTLNPASVTIVTPPATGSATVNPNGNIVYTPAGVALSDTFSYTVRDNLGAISNVATVLVSIDNQLPTANPDSAATTTGVPVVIQVTDNDTDPDGAISPATVTILTQPANGTAVRNANGTITYTSATLFAGTNTFTYRVSDNLGGISNATVVTVVVTNRPPTANNDTASAIAGQATVINVLANDTDLDSPLNPASVTVVGATPNGSATVNANGTITFTGSANSSFQYTVKDIFGGVSNLATVTVSVTPAPATPVAVNDSASTNVATAIAINVLANDAVTLPATVSIVAAPATGTAAVSGGSIIYTPPAGFAGPVTFTYRVSNATGTSNTATVTVQVLETITTSRVQFTVASGSWRIDGSTNARVAGEVVTFYVGNAIGTANIIGSATVSNNGSFTLNQTNSTVPDAANTISIGTSRGGTRLGIPISLK